MTGAGGAAEPDATGDDMPPGQQRPPHPGNPRNLVIAAIAFLLATGLVVLWIVIT
ncbi:MAG: hypothetical protein ACYC90_09510 [Candidatus Nanopelagicales bacterium]